MQFLYYEGEMVYKNVRSIIIIIFFTGKEFLRI